MTASSARPLTHDAARVIALIGALCVPTLPRLHVGMATPLSVLSELLTALQAAGLVVKASGAYVLTDAGRAHLAGHLEHKHRRVAPITATPVLAVSA